MTRGNAVIHWRYENDWLLCWHRELIFPTLHTWKIKIAARSISCRAELFILSSLSQSDWCRRGVFFLRQGNLHCLAWLVGVKGFVLARLTRRELHTSSPDGSKLRLGERTEREGSNLTDADSLLGKSRFYRYSRIVFDLHSLHVCVCTFPTHLAYCEETWTEVTLFL